MDPDDRVIVHPQHNREGFAMQTKWLPLALGLTLALGLADVKADPAQKNTAPAPTPADPKDKDSKAKAGDDAKAELKKLISETIRDEFKTLKADLQSDLSKEIKKVVKDEVAKATKEKKGSRKATSKKTRAAVKKSDDPLTAKKLDDLLLHAVNSGTVLYQFGQHEQAAYIYHVALINALAALDKIKASELELDDRELRQLKFRVVRAMATPAKDAAWRAVALRTAINDIRNAKLRKEKDTLVKRMGGQLALAFIYRDAMGGTTVPGRPATDCATAFPFYLNPYLQLFGATPDSNRLAFPSPLFLEGIGTGTPFFASGMTGFPYSSGLSGFGGLSPYGFGMPFGNTTQLQTALRNYCVPEPEANEFIARMMGLDLDDSKPTK